VRGRLMPWRCEELLDLPLAGPSVVDVAMAKVTAARLATAAHEIPKGATSWRFHRGHRIR
jgi:hypothetical protein